MSTILYTVHPGGEYINLKNISEEELHSGIKVYVNATNQCPCSCTFCLRQTKQMLESNTLWLKKEPTLEEILDEFKKYDLKYFKEVIFCGFGEPLVRVDDLMKVADYIKENRPDLPIRINTVGLANKWHERDITPLFKDRIDVISVSLNTPNKEEFYKLTRSKFGPDSQDYLFEFVKLAKQYVPKIVLSVVDTTISDEEIEECRKITEDLGVNFRVREFE